MQKNCGVLAYDELVGQLNGRTNNISLDTLAKIAQDNGFILFPMRVTKDRIKDLKYPYIVHHNHHFETWQDENAVDNNIGEPFYVLSAQCIPDLVVSENEARGVKGGDIGQMFTPPKSKSPWEAMTSGSTGGWAGFAGPSTPTDPGDAKGWGWVGPAVTAASGLTPGVEPLSARGLGASGAMGGGTGFQGTDKGWSNLGSTALGALGGYGLGSLGAGAGSALTAGLGMGGSAGGLGAAASGFGQGLGQYFGTDIIPGLAGSNPTAWMGGLTGAMGGTDAATPTAYGSMMDPYVGAATGSDAAGAVAADAATGASTSGFGATAGGAMAPQYDANMGVWYTPNAGTASAATPAATASAGGTPLSFGGTSQGASPISSGSTTGSQGMPGASQQVVAPAAKAAGAGLNLLPTALGAGLLGTSMLQGSPTYQQPASEQQLRSQVQQGGAATPLGQAAQDQMLQNIKMPTDVTQDPTYQKNVQAVEAQYNRALATQVDQLTKDWTAKGGSPYDPDLQYNIEQLTEQTQLQLQTYAAQYASQYQQQMMQNQLQNLQLASQEDAGVRQELLDFVNMDINEAMLKYGVDAQTIQSARQMLSSAGNIGLAAGMGMTSMGSPLAGITLGKV